MTTEAILARHTHLRGTLSYRHFDSEALGIAKPYYVYEPEGDADLERLPIWYLLRGHEREWVNFHEDSSRQFSTAIEDLEALIARGEVPPTLVVLPGLNSDDNVVPSIGIDMGGEWPDHMASLGQGRFFKYLVDELIPAIDIEYPQAYEGIRAVGGFSLGGFTASLLATFHPGYFDHVAIYDGTMMWPGHIDPRLGEGQEDRIWGHHAIFNAALGHAPRDTALLQRWNPTDAINNATESVLAQLRLTTYWIASADGDGMRGNRDRCQQFADLLHSKEIPLGFGTAPMGLMPGAAHTWHFCDLFWARVLQAMP